MANDVVIKPFKDSVISKIGFWQGLIVALISVISTVVVIAIAAGGTLARLSQVEKETEEIKHTATMDRSNVQNQLQDIQKNMVNKDDLKEFKQDMKDFIKQKRY